MTDDDTQVIPLFFRSDAEVEAFFDGEPLPEGPAPVERARRSPRKPTIDKLIAAAKAAGATSVVVEGVEMRFGPGGITAAASSQSGTKSVPSRDTNPWDAEIERLQ